MSLLLRSVAGIAAAIAAAWWLAPGLASAPEHAVVPAQTHNPPGHIRIARIETPRPVATAKPKPTPPRRPEGVPAGSRSLERGHALLEAGAFPRLRASYGRIGFAGYRDAVLALGGVFYLFDARQHRPLVQVDPRTGALGARELRAGLSRWPRDVTRHLPAALAAGRERFGSAASAVVLLPPAAVDAALLGALDEHLRAAGEDAANLLGVDVVYELRAGRLGCEVLALSLRGGVHRDVALHVDLSLGTRG